MLRELKALLRGREQVPLEEICSRLKINKEMVEHGLGLLIGKGLVEEVKLDSPCAACSCGGSCGEMNSRVFRLVS